MAGSADTFSNTGLPTAQARRRMRRRSQARCDHVCAGRLAPKNRLKNVSRFVHVGRVPNVLPLPVMVTNPAAYEFPPPLAGLEVLLVEHESVTAFVVEDMLFNLGAATVWHAADIDGALALLRDRRPGIAVVDVSLAGQPADPVVERLTAAEIPFVFVAGYGRDGMWRPWSDHVTVQKPFRPATLAAALRVALHATAAPPA